MLVPIDRFIGMPVMSIQTGKELATTDGVIIDPRQLIIRALWVDGKLLDSRPSVLHPEDIREISDIGLIVDSSDALMATDGLVRLEEVINFHFTLVGIRVEDELGHKLGTVKGFSIEPTTFTIQQLYTKPPLLQSFKLITTTIHRSQILSVDNEKIIVTSTLTPVTNTALNNAGSKGFVNPIAQASPPQAESSEPSPP